MRTDRRVADRARKARRPIEDIEIEYAARPQKPGVGGADYDRAVQFLQITRTRLPSAPEPVMVPAMVNGRRLEPWEAGLYVAWAHGERRRELAMFDGLIG